MPSKQRSYDSKKWGNNGRDHPKGTGFINESIAVQWSAVQPVVRRSRRMCEMERNLVESRILKRRDDACTPMLVCTQIISGKIHKEIIPVFAPRYRTLRQGVGKERNLLLLVYSENGLSLSLSPPSACYTHSGKHKTRPLLSMAILSRNTVVLRGSTVFLSLRTKCR